MTEHTTTVILEELTDDYGLPAFEYRLPREYRDNDLVLDISDTTWLADHARGVWVEHPASPDNDIALEPIKPDVFHDWFA